jgi:hypothetical protein
MYIYYVVFNATFSNISAILWQPFLVVEEVSEENHRPYCESSARRGMTINFNIKSTMSGR